MKGNLVVALLSALVCGLYGWMAAAEGSVLAIAACALWGITTGIWIGLYLRERG